MLAAKLHAARDLRIEEVDEPRSPAHGEALIRVECVGVCGSDLHVYLDGTIGDTRLASPLVLGHEFGGTVESAGPDARDGTGAPLQVGSRVAVDPCWSCGECDLCQEGHPNLCRHIRFCGLHPYDGALRERMLVPARACFMLPEEMDAETAALLEPLGIAVHAVDLSKIRVGSTVAVLGAGSIGLLIARLAVLAGAAKVIVSEPLEYRRHIAATLGTQVITTAPEQLAALVEKESRGRGADVSIEAAWADVTVTQAAQVLRPGGRLVLVGIPAKDELSLPHSLARRKGLTIVMVRRMKHTYPRAIELVRSGRVNLTMLATHRFPLSQCRDAFDLAAAYGDGVIKAVVHP